MEALFHALRYGFEAYGIDNDPVVKMIGIDIGKHLSSIFESDTLETLLNEIADLLKTSASDVRNISHNLFPRDLEKGIVAALTHLCEQNNYLNKNLKQIENYKLLRSRCFCSNKLFRSSFLKINQNNPQK